MLALEQCQHLRRIELPNKYRRSAEDDLRQRVHEQSARMEHREDIQVHIVMGHIMNNSIERVPRDHAIGDFRGFGQPCRAACEDQGSDVFGFEGLASNWRILRGLENCFKVQGVGETVAIEMQNW